MTDRARYRFVQIAGGWLAAAAGAVLIAPTAPAAPIFQGLGTLGTGFSERSEAAALSADGTTVVGSGGGSSIAGSGLGTAFRWTAQSGLVSLGSLSTSTPRSQALGVSGDGSVVVGVSPSARSQGEAFRWTLSDPDTGAGTMVGLGDLPGGPFSPRPGPIDRNLRSQATAISDDGGVILGSGTDDTGTKGVRFNGGPADLGIGPVIPADVSGDGQSFVGSATNPADPNGRTEAALFGGGGPQFLGVLPGDLPQSQALGISQDGSTVVGRSERRVDGGSAIQREAFRWTAETGMVGLGDLPGGDFDSRAFAASGDGSIVVGESETSSGGATRAFIWDETNSMRDLKQALLDDFGLGTPGFIRLTEAVDISADGRVITGTGINSRNVLEAWVVVLDPITPPPSDDRFIWNGACGTAGWHDTCAPGGQTITNWEDSNGQPTISPPGTSLPNDDVAEINNAAVTLQGQAADIQSLQATGSLNVQAPLSLAEDSGVQNLTVSEDLTTDGALNLNSRSDLANPVTDRWLAGTISGDAAKVADGSSKVVVQPNASLEISDGDKTLNTNLIVQGGARQQDGQLTIGNGGRLETTGTGRYEVVNGGVASTEAIVNAGMFRKFGGDGSAAEKVTVDAPFVNNGGRIQVDAGRLTFTGRNTHNGGAYRVEDGATLELLDEGTEVSGALSAAGGGNVELNGGSYAVKEGAVATFNLGGDQGLLLDRGVLVEAEGRLKNEGRLMFREGTIAGGSVSNGTVTGGMENAAGGTFRIAGLDGAKTLQGVLLNNGAIDHRPNTDLVVDGGRVVNRTFGEYRLSDNASISSANGTFDNAGGNFIANNAAEFGPEGSVVETAFNMSGDANLTVERGFLSLQGAGNHRGGGSFIVRDDNPDRTISSGLSFFGAQSFDGNFSISGTGAAVIHDAFTIQSGSVTTRMEGLDAGVGLVVRPFGSSNPSINASGGSFVNDGKFTFFNGLVTGGSVTDTGSVNGFQNRGGLVALSDLAGGDRVVAGVLRNFGSDTSLGVVEQWADLALVNGTILNEADGVYDLKRGEIRSGDGASLFRNRGGTLKKTGNGVGIVDVAFEMSGGKVEVEAGILSFSGPGSHEGSGSFIVSDGATLDFGAGGGGESSLFRGNYRIEGEGTAQVRGNLISESTLVANLTGPGRFVVDGLQAGGFNSPGAFLINQGNAEWKTGALGSFRNDGGILEIAQGDAAGKQLRSRLENTGTVDHLSATVTFTDRGRLINAGTYNLHGEFAGSAGAQGSIVNMAGGSFRLAAENATRTFAGAFDNRGTVEAARGSVLHLSGNVAQLVDNAPGLDDELSGGVWVVNDGGLITLGDDTLRVDENNGSVTMRGTGRLNAIPELGNTLSNRVDFENNGIFALREDAIFNTSRDFENNATLIVDATSALNVNGQFESNAGARNRIDGMLVTTDLDVDGGRFGGTGTINAQRFNAKGGLIGPGNSPGIMEVTGDYNHFAPAVLEIEIGGLIAGLDYDRLVVGGDANLFGGTLQVLLLDDFSPLLDQTFDILTAETIIGAFDLFDVPTVDGDPLFDLTVVNLIATGKQALRLTALATGLPDKEPPGGGSNDVPEPGFLVLLLAASLGLMALRPPGVPPSGYATRTEGCRRGGSTRPRPACRSGRAGSSGSACRSCG